MSDPRVVGRHDEEHLRRFVEARDRGDRVAMQQRWEAVVVDFDARMGAIVAGQHKGRLRREEHEEAVQRAMIRFATRLISTFEGRTMGELVNATKRLAFGICVDVQRESVTAKRRQALSLDDPRGAPGIEGRLAGARGPDVDLRRAGDAADALGAALGRLPARERRLMELSLAGAPIEDITGQLGVSRENAYQIRSRATRKLRSLLNEWDA